MQQLEFHALGRRRVVGAFDDEAISSDGGALVLREVEARTRIMARQFQDGRDMRCIEHKM